jgi:hypothetical protein
MEPIEFDISTIELWAYTGELDTVFDKYEEEDPDYFEIAVGNACSLSDIYRFTADKNCLKRHFFAQQLITQLCWMYRTNKQLPFHFSRMQGIMDRNEYLSKVSEHAVAVYERAIIIERMRVSDDPALQALANKLLNFRHEMLEQKQKEYIGLLRSINQDVLPLFKNA